MKRISQCRACGSKALTEAFSLPLPAAGSRGRGGPNVEFVYCDPMRDARACGLLQSAHAGAARQVWPEPAGRYAATRNALRQCATEALELISGRDCAALDIGCSDGTLLSFYPRWVERFGVDMSEIVETIGSWAWTARAGFPSVEIDRAFGAKKFDIITAISVFENVDDPRAFLSRVRSLLTADGVFVLETLFAPIVLTRTVIEAIGGGASAIYSLGALERIVRDSGLKIFRGAMTGSAGGSIRLFITHAEMEEHDFDPWYERLARLWDEENALALRAQQSYQAFERRALDTIAAFQQVLAELRDRGESGHLLGAGPASYAALAMAGPEARAISRIVSAAPDGCHDIGLPHATENESRAAEPDFLVAPAALKLEMMERWRETIRLGGKLLIPTPTPHMVHSGNYAAELARTLAGGDGAGGVETLRAVLGASGALRVIADAPALKSA
jgi:SAM-dependent methyltransferase